MVPEELRPWTQHAIEEMKQMNEADPIPNKAPEILEYARDLINQRGTERDQPSGERSIERAVEAFCALTGHALTAEDGWLFMVLLKFSRMRGGRFKADDYLDAVAYSALMAEESISFQNMIEECL